MGSLTWAATVTSMRERPAMAISPAVRPTKSSLPVELSERRKAPSSGTQTPASPATWREPRSALDGDGAIEDADVHASDRAGELGGADEDAVDEDRADGAAGLSGEDPLVGVGEGGEVGVVEVGGRGAVVSDKGGTDDDGADARGETDDGGGIGVGEGETEAALGLELVEEADGAVDDVEDEGVVFDLDFAADHGQHGAFVSPRRD